MISLLYIADHPIKFNLPFVYISYSFSKKEKKKSCEYYLALDLYLDFLCQNLIIQLYWSPTMWERGIIYTSKEDIIYKICVATDYRQ